MEITLQTQHITLDAPPHQNHQKDLPECIVGSETITKPSQLAEIKEAKADFSVIPYISIELIQPTNNRPLTRYTA